MGMNPKKLVRKVLPKAGIRLAEESYRKSRVYAMQARHGFPAKNLRVIAVTGTNGKTTTCNYINEMLKANGLNTALFTTAVIEVNGKRTINKTHRTVPLTAQLVSFLKQARDGKIDYLILEVTSQALDQHKLIGIPVEIAVMTNLTQDHLDYHKTMQAYAAAKARLFSNYMSPKHCVLNADDKWFSYFRDQSVGRVMSYGQAESSKIRMSHLDLRADGSSWHITEGSAEIDLQVAIPGEFNVYNATAAVCVGKLVGLNSDQLRKGMQAVKPVPGRMETIDEGQPYTVLVDYAHTPDALQNVLQAAHEITKRKVLVVFGATGDRDSAKRPIMGEVAAKHADMIFLTDDETYSEDGDVIRAAVRSGIEKAGGTFKEIADREAAITAAFRAAKPGDVVILAGIGHQDTRTMGSTSIKWDERDVARTLLQNLYKN
jgi:UDP-N-acetylmuramoyl-L-alanyl-D-glutamate--2,6-diaminopimelate ligase